MGVVALNILRPATAGRNDLALVDERVGYGDCLVEQPTGIVAEVQNDAFDLVASSAAA